MEFQQIYWSHMILPKLIIFLMALGVPFNEIKKQPPVQVEAFLPAFTIPLASIAVGEAVMMAATAIVGFTVFRGFYDGYNRQHQWQYFKDNEYKRHDYYEKGNQDVTGNGGDKQYKKDEDPPKPEDFDKDNRKNYRPKKDEELNQVSKKDTRPEGSIRKEISSQLKKANEHLKKGFEYIKDPLKFDNQGHLKNAVDNPVKTNEIMNGRLNHLATEIRGFYNTAHNGIRELWSRGLRWPNR